MVRSRAQKITLKLIKPVCRPWRKPLATIAVILYATVEILRFLQE